MFLDKIEFAKNLLASRNDSTKRDEWLRFSNYILLALFSIRQQPVQEITEKRKLKSLIIYDHYKIEHNNDKTLSLSINFNKNPTESDFTPCNLLSQRPPALPIKQQLLNQKENPGYIRHPNQNWLFDIQLYDDARGLYCAYSETEQHMPTVVNHYALAFYIKVCAYLGLLDKLNHEVLWKLGRQSANFFISFKHNKDDSENDQMTNLLLAFKSAASKDDELGSVINYNQIANANNWDFIKVLKETKETIKKSLKKMCREKEVLSYLDTALDGCFITDYMQAIENLKKYRAEISLIKKNSPMLFDYALSHEKDLKGLLDTNHFSAKNKVTDWQNFQKDFTFPQPLSLKNFRKFPSRYFYTQKHNILITSCLINYELLQGIQLTSPQKANLRKLTHNESAYRQDQMNPTKQRWLFLMCWVTFGKTWETCSSSELLVIDEWFSGFLDLNLTTLGMQPMDAYVSFARITDLLILHIREQKAIQKAEYEKNKELFENGLITRKERTSRNDSNYFSDFDIKRSLTDFVKGNHLCNGLEQSNLLQVKPSTTPKSLIRKSEKWHSYQVLKSREEKENLLTNYDFPHLNNTLIRIDDAEFQVLQTALSIHKEAYSMHHCIGSYIDVIKKQKYIALSGVLNQDKFTLGLSITRGMKGDQHEFNFTFHQCVGRHNAPVSKKVIECCSALIQKLNTTPELVLQLNAFDDVAEFF